MKQKNNVIIPGGKFIFRKLDPYVSSASNWDQGDMLVYNSSTKLVGPKPSGETGANLIGIAQSKVVNGSQATPFASFTENAAALGQDGISPADFGGTYLMESDGSITFNPGDKIYPGTSGTKRVTNVANSQVCIGVYDGAAVTLTIGQTLACKIGAVYPSTTVMI